MIADESRRSCVWLYIPPSTGSVCAAESADSTSASPLPFPGTEASLTSRAKPMSRRVLLREWTKGGSIRRLSGLTCEPSTAARGVASILSRLGFPAKASPLRASDVVRMMSGGYGRTLRGSSPNALQLSLFSRTSRGSCRWASTSSMPTFAEWATAWKQATLARRRSARLISATACSCLLPTPTAASYGTNRGGGAGRSGKVRPSLVTMANQGMWPTPQAHDSLKGYAERVGRFGTKHGGRNLNDWVQVWPTPTVKGDYNRAGLSSRSGNGLATAVKQWPTPTVRDWKSGAPNHTQENARPLSEAIGGLLNPAWVEAMQGFSPGWTEA